MAGDAREDNGEPSLRINDRLGQIMPAREPSKLFTHIGLECADERAARGMSNRNALLGALAVDRPLDRK